MFVNSGKMNVLKNDCISASLIESISKPAIRPPALNFLYSSINALTSGLFTDAARASSLGDSGAFFA